MFSTVKLKYKPETVKQPEWFMKATWTQAEQVKFGAWLAKYLYEHTEAQKELFTFARKSKKLQSERAAMFVMSYGWRLKNE